MKIIFEKQIIALGILFCLYIPVLKAQDAPTLPQRTGTVSASQSLHFGDLTIISGSSGGTVTVGCNGSRTCSGDIVLLNMGNTAREAIFEFKLCPGRTVTLNYSTGNITLSGANGGTLSLVLKQEALVGTTIVSNGGTFTSNSGCDDIHLIKIGGTITVSNISANPPGLYTGSFELTFIQE